MRLELFAAGFSNVQYHRGSNPGGLENGNGYVWILPVEQAHRSSFQKPGRDKATP
jgi:hypothetical protein